MLIQALLNQAKTQLAAVSATPQLDAEWLLAYVLNLSPAQFYIQPDRLISEVDYQHYIAVLQRRLGGKPVAYILGEWEFWSLPLKVTPDTLIPRPETEILVEQVLQKFPCGNALLIADLGTGSGAIALALASERPQWRITATDNSSAALTVANINAEKLQLSNVSFHLGDWCEALPEKNYDVIISNPPYIQQGDDCLHKDGICFEPLTALTSGSDGLQDLKKIISQASTHLKSGGWLFLEHGYNQAATVGELLRQHNFKEVTTYKDLAGLDRVTAATNP